jgi:hypothetical protein
MRFSAPRAPLAAALLLVAGTFAGCASQAEPAAAGPALAAPASGTAWQIVANDGKDKFTETSPDATPWITIGPDGSVNARIPASAQSQAAKASLQSGSLGVLTIHRAP